MDLREFLFRKKISITDFAKELMISRNYLNQICLGNQIPSPRLARDIERATKGEVTAKELLKEK